MDAVNGLLCQQLLFASAKFEVGLGEMVCWFSYLQILESQSDQSPRVTHQTDPAVIV